MNTKTRRSEVMLWTGQLLLAALFAFAGLAKLSMPADVLAAQSGLPGAFMHFVSWCELLGAVGLVLPCWFRIKSYLTPVAAVGLTLIMVGAVITSFVTLGIGAALMPFIVGTGTALIAWSRWPLMTVSSGEAQRAESTAWAGLR